MTGSGDDVTLGEIGRRVTALGTEVRDLRTHVDGRLDALGQGTIPAGVYGERNLATDRRFAGIEQALADEVSARKLGDEKNARDLADDKRERAVNVRWAIGLAVASVGLTIADILGVVGSLGGSTAP